MIKNNIKSLLIKIFSIICSVLLMFLSSCTQYMDITHMSNIYAAEVVIVEGSEAAIAALKWLIAAFAAVGAGSAAYENWEAVSDSYCNYLKSRVELGDYIADSAENICIQIYDKAGDAIQSISWDGLIESLEGYHGTAVNGLSGIYAKYSPQMLDGFDDFVADVLEGDLYVAGLSDALVECDTISLADMAQQWSGEPYAYSADFAASYKIKENLVNVLSSYTTDYEAPICGRYYTEYNWQFFRFICLIKDKWADANVMTFELSCYINGNLTQHEIHNKRSSWCFAEVSDMEDVSVAWSANFPVFSEWDDVEAYLKGMGTVEDALNYGKSMYDDITDNNDLPPFYKPYQQQLWERVANAPDTGIGSYGNGVNPDEWMDDIPWVKVVSLSDYTDSVHGVYKKRIDDVINGVYDQNDDIPDTYTDAWENAIADTWESVVDKLDADSVPGDGKPSDGDDKSDTKPTVEELAQQVPEEYKQVFKCEEFADELERLMRENGVSGERVTVESESGYILSDKNGAISENGLHYAIKADDIIYDNLNPAGIGYNEWLYDLGITDYPSWFKITVSPFN